MRLKPVAQLATALIIGVVSVIAATPPASAAGNVYNCVNGNSNPNNTDVCYIYYLAYNDQWVSELENGEDCTSTGLAKIRVRLDGDYQNTLDGNKFHLRKFSLRYLDGAYPWLYVQIQVVDGNKNAVNRDWNNNGGWIHWDGAGRDVDNTINLYPPASYAPVFGAQQQMYFTIRGMENTVPIFGDPEKMCRTGPWNLLLKPRYA